VSVVFIASLFARFACCLLLPLALGLGLAHAQTPPAPEPPAGWTPTEITCARAEIVVATNPLAVEAGRLILALDGHDD
jgi:hypothetical protein